MGIEHRTPCILATHQLSHSHTFLTRCYRSNRFALPQFSQWRSYKWSPDGVGGEGRELFLVFCSFSNSKYTNSTRLTTNEHETLSVTLPLALQWCTQIIPSFPSCPVALSPEIFLSLFKWLGLYQEQRSLPWEPLLFICLALLAELSLPVAPSPIKRAAVILQEYSLCCSLKRHSWFPCSAVTLLSISQHFS